MPAGITQALGAMIALVGVVGEDVHGSATVVADGDAIDEIKKKMWTEDQISGVDPPKLIQWNLDENSPTFTSTGLRARLTFGVGGELSSGLAPADGATIREQLLHALPSDIYLGWMNSADEGLTAVMTLADLLEATERGDWVDCGPVVHENGDYLILSFSSSDHVSKTSMACEITGKLRIETKVRVDGLES